MISMKNRNHGRLITRRFQKLCRKRRKLSFGRTTRRSLTIKQKLPEVKNENDEGDVDDEIIKSFKRIVALKKLDTTTDAGSACSIYTKREYNWKKVEQSEKILLIFRKSKLEFNALIRLFER